MAVFFGDDAPGILGFLAGLERTLHLGRTFHELVEVHRSELASNHPEIAAFGHRRLLLLTVSRTGSSCCGRRPPSERLHRRSIPCDRRRYRSRPCSDALHRRCPDGSPDAERSSHTRAYLVRRNIPLRGYLSPGLPCGRSATL